ncbi:MAG TPA: dolichyl-phosphate beta-glucosyltransferase [Chloroflexota bacterium]|nr:dolichyl-phosphate beta-glucosyltransferase [Chloroflexota bacterium]
MISDRIRDGSVCLDDTELLDLSIVVPALNEENRLPDAVRKLTDFLDVQKLEAEVLIVENASTDRTPEIADLAAKADARFRAVHLPIRGKGSAVRAGVRAARGRTIVFCDVDFSMPVGEISSLYAAVGDGADIAIASREIVGARRIGEPWRRHLMGRGFNLLVRLVAVPEIRDTQCGFKAFTRTAAEDLFSRQVINGWAFDVEVLFLARRRGYTLREVPVTWRYDASSRVRPLHDTIAMLRELFIIRWNQTTGRYA